LNQHKLASVSDTSQYVDCLVT